MDPYYLALTTITLASIYGLLALGISIIWSSLGMINMAQGFTFAVSGYGAWLAAQNISTQRLRRGRRRRDHRSAGGRADRRHRVHSALRQAKLPAAQSDRDARHQPDGRAMPAVGVRAAREGAAEDIRRRQLSISAPRSRSHDKIGSIVCSAILLLITLGWMKRSRRGLEIRAMMQNPEGAALVGVGLRSTAMAVMMVTGAMAGLASVLLSQTYFISPFAGTTPLVKGMVVALAGGLGSVAGALIAAMLIGFIEAFTAVGLGGQYVLITQFLFIIAVLLVRPRGIAGMIEHTRE